MNEIGNVPLRMNEFFPQGLFSGFFIDFIC